MKTDPIGPRSQSNPPYSAGEVPAEAASRPHSRTADSTRLRDDDGPPRFDTRRPSADSAAPPRRSLQNALTAAGAWVGDSIAWALGSAGPANPQASTSATKLTRGPYDATHGTSGVDLNVKVHVRLDVDPTSGLAAGPAGLVRCRHLALRFTQAGKKSDLMKDFASAGGVAKQFDGKLNAMEADFGRALVKTDPAAKHVVSSRQLGRYLAEMARALERPNAAATADFLLLTTGHAMAMHVARKSKDGEPYFAVKVYDPNSTANYKRVQVQLPEDLEHLQLADMLIQGQSAVDTYAPTTQPGRPISMMAVCLTEGLRPSFWDRSTTHATAENMFVALQYGALEDVRAMVSSARSASQSHLFELLEAKAAPTSGVVGLGVALEHGHAETVREFAAIVLSSALPPDRQAELLAAKDRDGVPGLCYALYLGNAETVRAFAGAVLNSALAPDQQAELLAAKTPKGISGLVDAIQNGHGETVKQFVQAVTASARLDTARQVGLLFAEMPKEAGGGSALAWATQAGHEQGANAFREAVRASPLPDDAKKELLAG